MGSRISQGGATVREMGGLGAAKKSPAGIRPHALQCRGPLSACVLTTKELWNLALFGIGIRKDDSKNCHENFVGLWEFAKQA